MSEQTKVAYFSRLGPGQAQQFSALAVLEKTTVTVGKETRPASYALRHLERWPPGTPYAEVFARVVKAFAEAPLAGSTLVVDQTGVGKPVITLLRKAKAKASLRLVTISSGQQATCDAASGWLLPRKELVGVMQVLLQGRRIQVAPSLPESQLLVQELINFKAKVTAASEMAVEAWREGEHDDLVLACASAAWEAERARGFNVWAGGVIPFNPWRPARW
jgi:hypothetical protein